MHPLGPYILCPVVLNPVPGPVQASFMDVLQELTYLGPKSSQEAAVGLGRSVWEELGQAGDGRRVYKGLSMSSLGKKWDRAWSRS